MVWPRPVVIDGIPCGMAWTRAGAAKLASNAISKTGVIRSAGEIDPSYVSERGGHEFRSHGNHPHRIKGAAGDPWGDDR